MADLMEAELIDPAVLNNKLVPITIVTGFLGSGKTTFLNHVLTEFHGKRIAVVQNEFGEELGLETATVVGTNGERVQEWLTLPNGCLCCTVKGDLAMTLETLAERKDSFDYIFIETTGMADPGPLVNSLWLDEALESSIFLDSIVTIVDAKHFLAQLNSGTSPNGVNEAQRQVAYADIIIINKCDLVTADELKQLEDRIDQVNSIALRIKTQLSRVDLNQVLSVHAFDFDRFSTTFTSHKTDKAHKHDHKDHKHHDHPKKPHGDHAHNEDKHHRGDNNDVHTVSFSVEKEVSFEALQRWLAALLWDRALPIFRIKAQVVVKEDPHRWMIHGVQTNFDVKATPVTWNDTLPGEEDPTLQKRCNKFVFIGKNLDKNFLRQSFEDLQV